MNGISRKMITEACEVLRTSGNEELARKKQEVSNEN